MEGCPLNYKIILIMWLKIAPSQWSLTTYISDSTLCVFTPYVDSGLSHLTGFGQWYVSIRIDFKDRLQTHFEH